MKKYLSLFLAISLTASILGACSAPPSQTSVSSESSSDESSSTVSSSESNTPSTDNSEDNSYDTVDFYDTLEIYTKETGNSIEEYGQSPDLEALVSSGELPDVEERISDEPMVVVPLEQVGTYGGRIRSGATSPVTGSAETWTARTQPLFIVGPDLQSIRANVAKGYAFNEDYTELTIYLREGMKWSDGEDFNADDFQFYYDAILCCDDILPTKPKAYVSNGQLAKFTKINDYEIKYTFAAPNPAIVSEFAQNNRMYLSVPFAPEHYLRQFHIKYNPEADKLAKENGYDTWVQYFLYIYPDEVQARWDTNLPSIDPWVLARTDEIGNKYFERNPYYWKIDTAGNQLPYIDGQDRLLYDAETVRIKLLAGELDMGLQFTNVDDFQLYKENAEKGDYRTEMWIDSRGQVLANMRMNLNVKDEKKRDLFNTLSFREGLSVAINREEINQIVWKGLATTRACTVSPSVSFYEDWMGEYLAQYDPALAAEKFDEAGLGWDSEKKYRTYPDGSIVELTLEYTNFEGAITTVLEVVKKNFEEVGIKTNLKLIDQSLLEEKHQAGELDFWIWNVDAGSEFGFYSNPYLYTCDAFEWEEYINTNGAEGIKPSAEYEEFQTKAEKFQEYPMGDENYSKYGNELLKLSVENVWNIGIAGLTPKPMILKNGLKNTPTNGVYDYDYRYWMIFHPEQWYWEE